MASSLSLGCRGAFLNAAEKGDRLHLLGLTASSTFFKSTKRQAMRSTCSIANLNPKEANSTSCALLNPKEANLTGCALAYAGDPFRHQRPLCKTKEKKRNDYEPVYPDKLDEWMRESVTEIVRNIGEAPFLVHVYSNKGEGCGTRLEREAAVPKNWPYITRRWEEGSCRTPDGVILVEELNDDEGGGMVDCAAVGDSSRCSKLWGIVVQGRGLDCAACYILRTSRVSSSVGFCTHFCLVRAKCFGETAELQLRNSWLQRQ